MTGLILTMVLGGGAISDLFAGELTAPPLPDAEPIVTRPPAPTSPPPETEPRLRPVGVAAVMYGPLVGGGAAIGSLAVSGAAGVRLRTGIGFVGVAHGRLVVVPNGALHFYGLGPGIRFGNRTQLTLAATPTFSVIDLPTVKLSGFVLSLLAQGALVLGDHFTLLVQPTLDFNPSGVIGSITGGVGVTF